MGEISSTGTHHVLLDDYYPAMETGWRSGWRAVIDGTNYDITGIEHDSQYQMTRVGVLLVTV